MSEDYQQHPKNPNGGYLKPSDYGADQFFGAIVLTRPLVEFLYSQGGDVKINIKVNELKNGEYGAYRRITAKAMTAEQTARINQAQAQPQPQPVAPIVQQAPVQPVQYSQGQPQPMQQAAPPAAPIQVPTPTPQYAAPTPAQPQNSASQPQTLAKEVPF